jgi:hypothetical protein
MALSTPPDYTVIASSWCVKQKMRIDNSGIAGLSREELVGYLRTGGEKSSPGK